MHRFLSKYRPKISAGLMVIGGLLTASFSISHDRFTSGFGGLIGAAMLIAGFVGWSWPKLQVGDPKTKRLTVSLGVLLTILLVLNIIQLILG